MIAVNETKNVIVDTLAAIWQMVTGTRSAKELGGIIRIGALAGDMAQNGMIALITFAALLSINLGLINLFPIPMLDGGHLLFYAIETIKGGPISEQIQEYAFRLGWCSWWESWYLLISMICCRSSYNANSRLLSRCISLPSGIVFLALTTIGI